MRRSVPALCALGISMLVAAAPASAKKKDEPLPPPPGATKNVEYLDNLPEAANATAINFLEFRERDVYDTRSRKKVDVLLVTGRFGLKTYSLKDPAHPAPLGAVTMEQLRLPGDPPASSEQPAVDVLAERGHGRGSGPEPRAPVARSARLSRLDEP